MSGGWAVNDDQVVVSFWTSDTNQMFEFAQDQKVIDSRGSAGDHVHDPS